MKKKEKERRPHCKVCGHFHGGPCTECAECTRGNVEPEKEKKPEPKSIKFPPRHYPEKITAEEFADRIAALDVRLTEVEQRINAVDRRRLYQKELMRKRRLEAKRRAKA